MQYNTLFTIHKPPRSSRVAAALEVLCGIQIIRKPPISKYTYNVYIKNGVIYSFQKNEITLFIKNNITYELYCEDYYNGEEPILKVNIYETQVNIFFTKEYEFILNDVEMSVFLQVIEKNYREYNNIFDI
jgi:hypothetical protein